MKLKKTSKLYLIVIAICMALIGLIAAYFEPLYENSLQGTSERGIYNVLKYTSILFLANSTIFFLVFVIVKLTSTHKQNKRK